MPRLVRVLLLAAVTFCLVAPSAGAAPTGPDKILGDLWTTVLETPTPENPFGGGDGCVALGGKIVAPLKPGGVASCTVKPGTRIFVAAWTTECSTFEGNGTSDAQLRTCARNADEGIRATVTINGVSVPLTEVETALLRIHLPQDNIFELKGADRKGLSVGHGLVYLTDPLAAGTTLTIIGHVVFPDGTTADFTTRIIVR